MSEEKHEEPLKEKVNTELSQCAEEAAENVTAVSAPEALPSEIHNQHKSDTDNGQNDKASYLKKISVLLKTVNWYKTLRIIFSVGFVVFAALFINEVFLTPYRINQSIKKTEAIYASSQNAVTATEIPSATEAISTPADGISVSPAPAADPARDGEGRLLKFKDLLAVNEEVKGWITIPDSNINYVVMQSGKDDPEYYLTRDIERKELKAGSLFIDAKGSVENESMNLTIHGHNMTSTDNMFHSLMKYKELDYYKERPVFSFDTIYQTGRWKIFAVFITNGGSEKEPLFDYTRADFENASDFMNFVYQLRIRSMYQIDTVDVNENDRLLTLSTCSYEVKNYRTVIAARRIRDGEDPTIDTDRVTVNPEPLYPYTYYYRYGGKAPELTPTFEEALAKGEINWYSPTLESME